MPDPISRRAFLGGAAAATLAGLVRPIGAHATHAAPGPAAGGEEALFRISLAQWSLNKSLRAGRFDNLDFPRVAKREYGIEAVEFVDQFFADKHSDQKYLAELARRASDEGVYIHLVMVDTAGALGTSSKERRARAIDHHKAWLDATRALGARTMRVNARGDGSPDELRGRIVESCAELARHAASLGLNLVIENHGGPSSDPEWLARVMREVAHPRFGTLPDFGNFPGSVDRYLAVEKLMPFAKAVSAKSGRFTPDGLEASTDYFRMLRIVRDQGYPDWIGVESGARSADGEPEAVRLTKALLETIRSEHARRRPIFNGRDFTGWKKVHGGDWTIEDGALVGRNGKDWAVDAEKTGSWLRTEKEYSDFVLELQYQISPGGNSGVFFRSALEKNPAFTGYEMQITDAVGAKPGIWSPLAICMRGIPTKTVIRPSGEWNTVTITCRGEQVTIEGNGEKIIDQRLDHASRGYIGLQNHDEKAVVRFRNIRLEEL